MSVLARIGALSELSLVLFAGMAMLPVLAAAGESTLEPQENIAAIRIVRVLPGVVGIQTEVRAEVSIRCGKHDTYVVKPDPLRENGTGFIIHPDGWIATNGHVVKPVYRDDEAHITHFLRVAADAVCGAGLAKLPARQRSARRAAILRDPGNRKGVTLTKKLDVYLPTALPPGARTHAALPAVVKAYSPPIDPDQLTKDGRPPTPPMWDAALIKVEAANLPVVRLAPSIKNVYLAQELVIVGYPGAVVWHDFLSQKSRTEATVTYGRVSSFRLDINDRQILQTQAPISGGSSGGPAFNLRGEVIGLATFLSTSPDGHEAIQGFNFLIPIDSIHALAKAIGLTPTPESTFTQAWNEAVDAIIEGRYREALGYVGAADRIVPGLIDVERVRTRLRDRLEEKL
jgi:serine protease Do